MKRETKTFPKGNWSGEQATIYFNGSTWSQLGYRFWLEPTLRENGRPVAYDLKGSDWKEPLAKVYELGGRWFAEDDPDGGISRDDEDPRVAAAQLLFNTV